MLANQTGVHNAFRSNIHLRRHRAVDHRRFWEDDGVETWVRLPGVEVDSKVGAQLDQIVANFHVVTTVFNYLFKKRNLFVLAVFVWIFIPIVFLLNYV